MKPFFKKPVLTANRVTLARIGLLPIPCFWIYTQNVFLLWASFILLVFLGMTDFIDGILARREGPTKLGTLLDPVADKIFILSVLFPLAFTHIIPTWSVPVIVLREFWVTALRTLTQTRGCLIKTSLLSKIKTIFQMGGVGTIFLTYMLPQTVLGVLMIILASAFFGAGLYLKIKYNKIPFYVIPVGFSFVYVLILSLLFGYEISIVGQIGCICVLTWVSALDYMKTGLGVLWKTGFKSQDIARLLWGFLSGACMTYGVFLYPATFWYVLLLLSFEFALGGIDNILAAEGKPLSQRYFWLSSLNIGLFTFILLQSSWFFMVPLWSAGLLMYAFWKNRACFLG